MLKHGIIVSIQGYSLHTTEEMVAETINAGAIAIKTDKPLKKFNDIQIIGCEKMIVRNPETEPYLTSTIDLIDKVSQWSDYVSIDYRKLNNNLKNISDYCREKKIKVIADIGTIEDFENIKKKNYHYDYIATTFTIFNPKYRFYPDLDFAINLKKLEKYVIAEGNIKERKHVRDMYRNGINHICIGGAITNIYKLTRKFTTVMRTI